MEIDDLKAREYLEELFNQSNGDSEAKVSMYDIGAAIGLERGEAGELAQELIIQGAAELRSLAGAISISREGIELLHGPGTAAKGSSPTAPPLGSAPTPSEAALAAIATIITAIRGQLGTTGLDGARIEEVVIDLKTLEVQLLSPRPKTAIIREILRSLLANLPAMAGVSGPIQALLAA